MRLATAALICTALSAGAAQAQVQPVAPGSAQTELMAADRAFSRLSVTRGRAHAFLTVATNSAQFFGTGGVAPVQGRAQAFRALSRRDSGRMGWEPLAAGVSGDGRMGWTNGRWELTQRGVGAGSGYYLTVWVKDRRNAWKVQAHMNTGGPAKK